MKDYTVVLAVFETEAAAESAAETIKSSGLARHEAIGILALDGRGEIKAERIGKHSVGAGAGIGLVLSLLTPVGLGVGLVGGGLLGALHHKGLGMSEDDRERLGHELTGGKAAVGVLSQVGAADAVLIELTELGGIAKSHFLYAHDLDEAHAAVTHQAREDADPHV
jgi:uncharacterized membrane protein